MDETKVALMEASLVGCALRNGVALGPAGRRAVLMAEKDAWSALAALDVPCTQPHDQSRSQGA